MEWNDHNWKRYYDLDYKCRLSALYHRKRERYYALLDKFSTALALIAGSAAFSDLLHTPEQKSIAGGLVALVTLPSLVFAWSDNAKLHATLAARFIQIEAEMQKMGALSAQTIDEFSSRLRSLEAEEPPELSALVRACQNEIAFSENKPESITKLTFWERHLRHVFDMPAT